jgi:hypothetical protein
MTRSMTTSLTLTRAHPGDAHVVLSTCAGPVETGDHVLALGDLLLAGPVAVGEGGEPAGEPLLRPGPAGLLAVAG